MKKSILLLFVFILLSCSRTSIFRMEGPNDFLNKYASDTLTIKNKEDASNNAVENDIPEYVIVGLKKWKKDRYYSKKYGCDVYERQMSLYNTRRKVVNESFWGLKVTNSNDSFCFKKENLIYVGEWEYVKNINKNIRYVACQTDRIYGYFEAMDEKNKDIKYMPLKLKYPIKPFTQESEELNIIKWFDRYGYNAYVDLKTGEIKQVKE